ncbi:MAG: hypothetical protein AB7O67_10375 [Vicinamibacterales bacterium]
MMPGRHIAIVLLSLSLAGTAAAQETRRAPVEGGNERQTAGWTISPALGFSAVRDDNVLFDDEEAQPVAETVSVVQPAVTLGFRNRRTEFGGRYLGSYVAHQDLSSLNSYEQRVTLGARHMVSRRTTVFARHSAAALPTTELLELQGIPYTRVGSRLQDLNAGVEFAASRRTDVSAAYHFQWVDFDRQQGPARLMGGYSHGANVQVTHDVTPRTAVTGEYRLDRASLADGETFAVQVGWGGVQHRLSDDLTVFGEAGFSRLGLGSDGQTGPAWRAGLARDFRRAGVSIIYSRSYVPSYGFGGTLQNEDVTGRLRLPIGRRAWVTTAAAWRSNDPLEPGQLSLETLWFDGTVGYAFTPWMRVEGFVSGAHQTIDRPGGTLDRFRYGIQVTTSATARIR